MERHIEKEFKKGDEVLEKLVTARREEVVRLQKVQADQLESVEAHGQERIASLRKTLPRGVVAIIDSPDRAHREEEEAVRKEIERVRAKLIASDQPSEGKTGMHPGLAGGHLLLG